jgi:pimeloyl-ACP methyl ester carboxylesterase
MIRFRTRADAVLSTAVALAILLCGCKASHPNTPGAPSNASTPRPNFARLVNIGHREIFLTCRGSGTPIVVLIGGGFEAGWMYNYALDRNDPALTKKYDAFSAGEGHPRKQPAAVFPSVAKFTRVCSYDRPNTTAPHDRFERNGLVSTPVRQPHELKSDVTDLHALLAAAGEPGPYVLVGHSYGGLIAELFASMYPKSVAGLVLLDMTSQYVKQTETPQEFAALVAYGRQAQNAAGWKRRAGFEPVAATGN